MYSKIFSTFVDFLITTHPPENYLYKCYGTIITCDVPDLLPIVAVTVSEPTATPVTSPELDTTNLTVLLLVHVNTRLFSAAVESETLSASNA